MKVKLNRNAGLALSLAAVALAVAWGFMPGAVPVDTAKATRGPLRVTVDEQGRTQVKDRYVISAPVAGFMRRITLEAGDPVAPGQQVACLEPVRSQALDPRSRAEARAAVNSVRAALSAAEEKERAARAEAEYAAQRSQRLGGLLEKHSVAQDTVDQAFSDARKAEAVHLSTAAEVEAARSELARARSLLRNFTPGPGGHTPGIMKVCCPVAGRVLRIYRKSEGTVAMGEPLMDVGAQQDLEVRVEVLSSDAVKLRKGTPVLFERWGGDVPLAGTVRVVEPGGFTKISSLGVEEQRVVVLVDLTTPRDVWQNLGDAYRLDASFIVWEGRSVLQVPSGAVFRRGAGWAVYVAEKGRARLREVRIGHTNGLATEVVSGFEAGQEVIVNPDDAIREGARVKARE
jgi:HlyD family secretion protein